MAAAQSFASVACAALLLVVAGCASSDDSSSSNNPSTPTAPAPTAPTPPPPVATTTVEYNGVFASGTFTGTVSMSAAVPVSSTTALRALTTVSATGTAKFTGAAQPRINLAGTYDTTENRFLLSGGSGGGWTVEATVSAETATGTIRTPVGSAGVAAQLSTSSSPATQFCGTFNGTETGKFLVVVGGAFASGVANQDGEPNPILLTGNAGSGRVFLHWQWTDDLGRLQGGEADGTISGSTISGTWFNTEGARGAWGGAACM